MSLILPCAGSSTRFPNMKPKWLLTAPSGNLMIQEAIKNLNLTNIKEIYITCLKEHVEKYDLDIYNLFIHTNKNIFVIYLDNKTNNQPDTVLKTIEYFDIKGPIFIKDCDNSFSFNIIPGDYICSLKIDDKNNVDKLYNKSFIQVNDVNEIINISEKNIISDKICIGGYSFSSTDLFIKLLSNLDITNENLFISHIIYQGIINDISFNSYNITKYYDWGTLEDWNKYKNEFKTLFIDIDGTLFLNSSEHFTPKWGESEPILDNINHIKDMYNKGNIQIILTTSRKEEFREKTIQQLREYGIPYDNIIFNLLHCKRYLINDYSVTNPYPTAVSVNLKRNDNSLNELL
tara:strand:+ start:136 stop:1173 length:1038 start_codon:yes stop_codon:yes gene_type:complete